MTRLAVAVFGSSEPREGDALYDLARTVGRTLATTGYDVVTGGYGGVMEGASRGAVEGGGAAHGVLCAIFDARRGNPYLTSNEVTTDLVSRTGRLIDRAAAFVVLDGKAGTLAELAFLWALHRAGCLDGRPVIIWSDAWGEVTDMLSRRGHLDRNEFDATFQASDPREAVDTIARLLR